MNEAQHLKYRICGAQAVKAMKKLGHQGTHKELTAYCRRQALGIDKESVALNNIEFDAVLAVFAGWHSMADLGEQLRLQEQPLKRILFAAAKFLDELEIKAHGREAYLAAIYKRVQGGRAKRGEPTFELEGIPDEDFPLVLGALFHTLEHRKKKSHNHPRTGRGRRSRYAHGVGSRSQGSSQSDEQTARPEPRPETMEMPF